MQREGERERSGDAKKLTDEIKSLRIGEEMGPKIQVGELT